MTAGFIVVFDDDQGMCVPMGWDADCEGAVCATSSRVALFPTRAAARQAIRISTAWARLRKAQGRPENTDFTDALACVKVLPLEPAR